MTSPESEPKFFERVQKLLSQHPADERPFFGYLEDEIRVCSSDLKAELSSLLPADRCDFFYSMKTNPNSGLLKTIANLGWGFDVSSVRELRHAVSLVGAERVQFSGCAKEVPALQASLRLRPYRHHVDSVDEWNWFRKNSSDQYVRNLSLRLSVEGLRDLGLKYGFETRDILPEAFAAKHGLSRSEIETILGSSQRPPFQIAGLHFYLGREQYSRERLTMVAGVLRAIRDGHKERFIDDWSLSLGPGVPVRPGNEPEEISSPAGLAPATSPAKIPKVSFEIGRALVGRSGFYAAQVLAVKQWGNGRRSVIINGGLQHLGSSIRPVYGTSTDDETEVFAIDGGHLGIIKTTQDSQPTTVFGSLCLSHDILLARVRLPANLKRGDWLLIPNTGAYGLTAGVPRFIHQDLPREFLIGATDTTEVTHENFGKGEN